MSSIQEIEKKLKKIYKYGDRLYIKQERPNSQLINDFLHYSDKYMCAAAVLRDNFSTHTFVIMQLAGQSIELSLKAYLLSAGKKLNKIQIHNLIKLYSQCELCGLEMDDKLKATIVHINHYYSEDLATETRFKSRYPTQKTEVLGGPMPIQDDCLSIISILKEFTLKNISKSSIINKSGTGNEITQ